ncbi:hypothetical protein HanLR1_Chr01g0017391 [Helianthus annuus]|nr:hypothetical protein HanLR1_Chr01g0017391 [Helianthus annuus]
MKSQPFKLPKITAMMAVFFTVTCSFTLPHSLSHKPAVSDGSSFSPKFPFSLPHVATTPLNSTFSTYPHYSLVTSHVSVNKYPLLASFHSPATNLRLHRISL